MTSSYQKLRWKEALGGCFFPHTTFILAWTSVSLFLISGPDTPTWVAGGEDTGIWSCWIGSMPLASASRERNSVLTQLCC